jgi:hypothetical protein
MRKVEITSLQQKRNDQAHDESKLTPTARLEAAFQLIDLMREFYTPTSIIYPEDEFSWINLRYRNG